MDASSLEDDKDFLGDLIAAWLLRPENEEKLLAFLAVGRRKFEEKSWGVTATAKYDA